jgi:transcriptional regulator with XRE-family HTH domain
MKVKKITDRLRKIRNTLHLSQREFSKQMFISQSLYSDIESGNVELKERYIRLISSQFNINIDWLKDGVGEMFKLSQHDVRLEYLIDIFNQLSPNLQDCVLDHLKGLLKVQKEKKC